MKYEVKMSSITPETGIRMSSVNITNDGLIVAIVQFVDMEYLTHMTTLTQCDEEIINGARETLEHFLERPLPPVIHIPLGKGLNAAGVVGDYRLEITSRKFEIAHIIPDRHCNRICIVGTCENFKSKPKQRSLDALRRHLNAPNPPPPA